MPLAVGRQQPRHIGIAELQHRRVNRGRRHLRVQAAQGGAQSALEHHLAVVSPFGLGSIGSQLRAEGMAIANLLKPGSDRRCSSPPITYGRRAEAPRGMTESDTDVLADQPTGQAGKLAQ